MRARVIPVPRKNTVVFDPPVTYQSGDQLNAWITLSSAADSMWFKSHVRRAWWAKPLHWLGERLLEVGWIEDEREEAA